jgi:hypothetical protein
VRLTLQAIAATLSLRLRQQPKVVTVSDHAVEVRSSYVGDWSSGFEIAEATRDGFLVRRQSDGALLPGVFPPDDVREVDQP